MKPKAVLTISQPSHPTTARLKCFNWFLAYPRKMNTKCGCQFSLIVNCTNLIHPTVLKAVDLYIKKKIIMIAGAEIYVVNLGLLNLVMFWKPPQPSRDRLWGAPLNLVPQDQSELKRTCPFCSKRFDSVSHRFFITRAQALQISNANVLLLHPIVKGTR